MHANALEAALQEHIEKQAERLCTWLKAKPKVLHLAILLAECHGFEPAEKFDLSPFGG